MVAAQDNLCAACGNQMSLKGKNCHVDHCHKTGRIRALLCRRCNTTLGLSGDDATTLRLLADYVEMHSA
jgi:hypothetical protein